MPELSQKHITIATFVIGLGLFLTLILVPLSFSYVEIDEWAFRKSKLTNKVDTTKIYGNGRYFFGISSKVVVFERPYQHLEYVGSKALSVFSSNGLQLKLECNLQYRLIPSRLAEVYSKLGTVYATQINAIATAAIKNAAPKFSVNDFIDRWENVSRAIATHVSEELFALGVEMPIDNFQIQELAMPQSVSDLYLATATRLQENQKKGYQQVVDLIGVETERIVSGITANTTSIKAQALGEVARVVAEANAEAYRLVQSATGSAIAAVMDALQIPASNVALKTKLIKLLGLLPQNRDSKASANTHFISGVNPTSIILK